MSDSDRSQIVSIISNFYSDSSLTKESVLFVLNYLRLKVPSPQLFAQLENAIENAEANQMSAEAIQKMKQSVVMTVIPLYDSNTDSRYMFDFISLVCGYLGSFSHPM